MAEIAVPNSRRDGFTLIELVVTLALTSVVAGGLIGVLLKTQFEYFAQREGTRGEEALRSADAAITRLLRTARADPLGASIGKLDANPLGHAGFDNIRVRGDFNPADGDVADPLEDVQLHRLGDTLFVRWQAGGPTQALAQPVRALTFQYFATDGTPLVTATTASAATQVKFTLQVPRSSRTSVLTTRESWVYLRNQ